MKELKREKVWETRYTFGDPRQDEQVRRLAAEIGRSELFAALLYNRGYQTAADADRFLRLEQNDLHDPYQMADMEKAVARIFLAVERKEPITIYGDYDVDGVTSVTALYLYLTELGAQVNFKIPKRDGEGYGVSCSAVKTLAEAGTRLIITVDTGITAVEEVRFAKELSVDFVVTDHHECRAELPEACAVVNPHRPDCPYPFKELAGVGVVFKLICACETRRCRESGTPVLEGIRRVCTEYADLTAVGTIADVMPVVDENRLIVSFGLKLLEHTKRPGLHALIEAAFPKKSGEGADKKITSGMVGFGLAPRINAAGRMSDAAIAVRLLLEQDAARAAKEAEELCEINRRRQAEENRIATEAYEQIEQTVGADDLVIVLNSDHWQQGIIGIVSSRITERFGLPSILISFDGSCRGGEADPMDDGKGSGRSIKGMNLVEALTACEDLLIKYGGHELAAGLTVKRANLDAFRQRINEYAKQNLTEDVFRVRMEADAELTVRDVTMKMAEELSLLEPFGVGNAAPVFLMRNAHVKKITHMGGGKHTRLLLEQDGICLTALYFGVGEGELGFSCGDLIDVLFTVDINDYKNVRSVQMVLQDTRMAQTVSHRLEEQKRRYDEICGGAAFFSDENVVPTREDCAEVYKLLRWAFRNGTSVIAQWDLMKLLHAASREETISYIKLKYILRILNELQICEVEELEEDLYRFGVLFRTSKTSIDQSSILKKLKSQCRERA